MESNNTRSSLACEGKIRPYNKAVHIHIHSIRRRLVDPDAVSGKAAIDGIVKAGLLRDDTVREIASITYSQEKGEPETIITIAESE